MKRFLHVVRHEALSQARHVPMTAAAVAGSVLLITAVTWIFDPGPPAFWSQFPFVFVIVSAILTSGVYRELQDEARRIEFLLRPTTHFEKTGAKLLVSLLGYWLVFVAVWTVGALIARGGYAILFGVPWGEAASSAMIKPSNFPLGHPWHGEVPMAALIFSRSPLELAFRTLLTFVPIHGLYFFGSVYFRRRAFGRTLLSLVVWGISYLLIGVVLTRVVMAPYWTAPGALDGITEEQFLGLLPRFLLNPARTKTVFDIAISTIFYGLAWRRLSETEG